MRTVNIGNRPVGEGEPCFIIAEAGVNHNGDVSLARKLVEAASAAGVDAVKFQTFHAESLVVRGAEKARYQQRTTGQAESQFDMLQKLALPEAAFRELKDHAESLGLTFLSTPYDEASVDLLVGLGVAALKVSSADITNHPLLSHIAAKKLPVILGTGISTLDEVREAVAVLTGGGSRQIILLHCVSSYPAKVTDTNLKAIVTLRNAFKLPVGFSDHSTGITLPVAATALGACVIEKHFTLDKKLPGPDHSASLEPEELKRLVAAIRDVEKAMGDGTKQPAPEEKENIKAMRRSIVAGVDIPQGVVITRQMLAFKRPGTGISPAQVNDLVGRKAKTAIKQDSLINQGDLV